MNFRRIPVSALLVALLLAVPTRAFAWGPEGHEIVATLALRELTPVARGQVAHLLGGETMMIHDASWADEIRSQRPETGTWHYVNIPLTAPGYDPRRDCARGDCVVAQIGNDTRILADRRAPAGLRAEALRFLIHFVGDMHQPLHAGDKGDRGGNDIEVAIGRDRANLHKVWDVHVVEGLGLNTREVANGLARGITPDQRKAWTTGTPASWINESHAIARDVIYRPLEGRHRLRLPRDYARREAQVTREQLAKAGLRLAFLLNSALR